MAFTAAELVTIGDIVGMNPVELDDWLDIGFKIFTEGVIQDDSGTIIYNLMQQDMSAMRMTFRVGWQVANLINRDQATEGNRYPAASLDIA